MNIVRSEASINRIKLTIQTQGNALWNISLVSDTWNEIKLTKQALRYNVNSFNNWYQFIYLFRDIKVLWKLHSKTLNSILQIYQ